MKWDEVSQSVAPLYHSVTSSSVDGGRKSSLDTLSWLEAEGIHIIREVAAECERPCLLFSGGKDSIVMLRLAEKAFWPGADSLPCNARRYRPQLPRGN